MSSISNQMKAVAIESFGGVDKMKVLTLPVPQPEKGEVLLKIAFAGVAVWDPIEREGIFAKMMNMKPKFPLVLGSEGSGQVVAAGAGVQTPKVGDTVYACGFLNPKGGFYAEYVAVKADLTAPIPKSMNLEQAAVFSADAGTALRGLEDVLHVKAGESVMIFGAGGGLGHLAVQLARRLGAKVFAVASGADGVALAKKVGAEAAVDGRKDDVVAAAKIFAPGGLDAALLTAGGTAADKALTAMRSGGRVAYPNGVDPKPKPPSGIATQAFDGDLDGKLIERLSRRIGNEPFHVEVAKSFPLAEAAASHRMLDAHYLGKIGLKVGS